MMQVRVVDPQTVDVIQWTCLVENHRPLLPLLVMFMDWAARVQVRVTWSNDTNLYGKLTNEEAARLFEPWDTAEEAHQFETTVDGRLRMRQETVDLHAEDEEEDEAIPNPSMEQALLHLAAKVRRTSRTQRVATPQLPDEGWVTLLSPPVVPPGLTLLEGCTRVIIVLSVDYVEGLHREDQPWLAAELDRDAADMRAMLRAAARRLRPTTALVLVPRVASDLAFMDTSVVAPVTATDPPMVQVRTS
jgi:hypothetical protein